MLDAYDLIIANSVNGGAEDLIPELINYPLVIDQVRWIKVEPEVLIWDDLPYLLPNYHFPSFWNDRYPTGCKKITPAK